MRTPLILSLTAAVLCMGCADKPAEKPVPTKPAAAAAPAAAPKAGAKAAQPAASSQPAAKAPALKAHGAQFAMKDAPKGAWSIDGDNTLTSFVIVSNSAGPITGRFPKGTAGWVHVADGKTTGTVHVDLSTLSTTNKAGVTNDIRDARVVEAFFGAPLSDKTPEAAKKASVATKDKVAAVWKKLDGILPTGVTHAGFVATKLEGLDALKDGTPGALTVHGDLVLWDTVKTPVSFALTATKTGNKVVASSTKPTTINLLKLLGDDVRALAFETMLAAGCAHQPGIQNDVAIRFDKLVFTR